MHVVRERLRRALILGLFLSIGALWFPAKAAIGPMDENIFVKLADRVIPSVVNISTIFTVKSPFPQGTPEEFFRRFFEQFFGNNREYGFGGGDENNGSDQSRDEAPALPGQGAPTGPLKAMSLGSGFIIDPSGIILTNNHVVANADEIKIQFTESETEKPTDGKVIGRDPELDVALIRVKTTRKLVALPLGDSDRLKVGEYVMAVGNPFGQGHSATHGIISAKGRFNPEFPLGTYLQTDAPINPGNSGGPLVTLDGEVVGINTAMQANAQGIGFATPITLVKQVLHQLEATGGVQRGYLGVLIEPLAPEVAQQLGLPRDLLAPFVTQVYPDSPGARAGLKPYDVITEFNGKHVRTPSELTAAVTGAKVGEKATLKILRNGRETTVPIEIGKRPEPGAPREKRQKRKEPSSHVQTGMALDNVTPEIAHELGLKQPVPGAVVTAVVRGSPADQAGIDAGDIIVEVDRKPIHGVQEFYSIVKEKKRYLLRLRRPSPVGQELFTVTVLDLGK